MDSAVTFLILVGCCSVRSSPSGPSASFSVSFSGGTRLQVGFRQQTAVCDEDDEALPHHSHTEGSSVAPSIQVLSSVRLHLDPESPPLLVCLLNRLQSPWQRVTWRLDDKPVVSAEGPWTKAEEGYSATLVWEVSAADWRPSSSYWCGTIQEGEKHGRKLLFEN